MSESSKQPPKSFSESEKACVLRKLAKYCKQKNVSKMRYYLGLIQRFRPLYESAVDKFGAEWLHDKFVLYVYRGGAGVDVVAEQRSRVPRKVQESGDGDAGERKRMSASEYLRRRGINVTADVENDEKQVDPFMEENLVATDGTSETFPDFSNDIVEEATEEQKRAAKEILATVSLDNVESVSVLDYIKSKKTKTLKDRMFLLAAEKEDEERKRLAKEEAEHNFIMKCSIRRYANDPDPDEQLRIAQLDPAQAAEHEHFARFTKNVRAFIFENQFPLRKVINHMNYCDVEDIRQFQANNPSLANDFEEVWKYRCRNEFECKLKGSNTTWIETYRICAEKMKAKLAMTARRYNLPKQANSALPDHKSTANTQEKTGPELLIPESNRKRHSSTDHDRPGNPSKHPRQEKGPAQVTPLMAKTMKMYRNAATKTQKRY